MDFKTTSHKKSNAGIALAEMMIGIGLGVLLVTTMTVVNVYYLKAFAGLENYMNLNNDSRQALDVVTKDIRQADKLISYSATGFTLQLFGTNVTYSYDSANRQLNRNGRVRADGKPWPLLVNCDYWRNDFYNRNMITNGVTGSDCKVIQLTWLCSRTILGRKANTEDVQSAKIVIRKQK